MAAIIPNVKSLSVQGQPQLKQDVVLVQGSNVSLSQAGQNITIASTAVGGGISLTGWHLLASPSNIYGWTNASGPTTGNVTAPIYYNTTNATGDIACLGFVSSISGANPVQSRWAFIKFNTPIFATGWGVSGVRIRMTTSSTTTGMSSISLRIADAFGNTVSQENMVAESSLALRDYIISGAQLPAFNHDVWSARLAFYCLSGQTGLINGLEGHFV